MTFRRPGRPPRALPGHAGTRARIRSIGAPTSPLYPMGRRASGAESVRVRPGQAPMPPLAGPRGFEAHLAQPLRPTGGEGRGGTTGHASMVRGADTTTDH